MSRIDSKNCQKDRPGQQEDRLRGRLLEKISPFYQDSSDAGAVRSNEMGLQVCDKS